MYRKNLISAAFLRARHEKTLGLLEGLSPRDMLDVGCDDGQFLLKFAERFPASNISACDMVGETLTEAKKACPKAAFQKGDFMELSLKPVELVTMLEVLEHSTDPRAMLEKAAKLVGKNGHVLVSMPRSELLRWRVIWTIWSNIFGRRWLGQHSELTQTQVIKLASESGLALKRRTDFFLGCISIMLFKQAN